MELAWAPYGGEKRFFRVPVCASVTASERRSRFADMRPAIGLRGYYAAPRTGVLNQKLRPEVITRNGIRFIKFVDVLPVGGAPDYFAASRDT